jgi:eukaryotic-like serine/threonine-protein kinase
MALEQNSPVPPFDSGIPTLPPEPNGLQSGSVIGPYRLLELIGEGGMGQVWLAEQKEPVRRRVALKLIKAGMDTREVVARFQSERQALAMMDHPAIAKVFDAGSTLTGRPYFVMEYVPGQPVTTYADKHRLTTQQRLELFIRICDGVQHAHQKAIIHRDLKPSNILVSEVDGKPMPRIIDFGVAKAVASRIDSHSIYTQLGTVIGTLGYISPEQADSAGEDIDTRSDVYSLGAILYELLVGALPHDFRKIAFDEVLRRLREEDVLRPSTKIHTMGGDSVGTARSRGTEPEALVRQLRGDPDAIVLKALEKDRQRRYSSASEFASDIGRYLRNEPVIAHAPTAGYRIGKYIRRHRVGVGMAAVALLALVAVAVAQTVALRRITRERDRADRVVEFMRNMFKVSDPSQARGNSVTARELLDKASQNIQTGLKKDPELQASMMATMGQVYQRLGLYQQGEPLLRQSLNIRQSILGPRNRQTLETAADLMELLTDETRFPEAEKLGRDAAEGARSALGPADSLTLTMESRLGAVLEGQGRYSEAEAMQRKVLAAVQKKYPGDDHKTLLPRQDLAVVLAEEGNLVEAEKTFRELLAIDHRELGDLNPNTLDDMDNLSSCLLAENKYADAEKLYRQTLELQRRVLGPDHPNTLRSMISIGEILQAENQYPEAETIFRDALEKTKNKVGNENRLTLKTASDLALVLQQEKKYPEADRLVEETLQTERRVLGPAQPDTLATLNALGNLRMMENRLPEGEQAFREMLENSRKALGDDHFLTAAAAFDLANAQVQDGKREEAIVNLQFAVNHAISDHARASILSDDFKALHNDPRWDAIAAKAKQQPPAR